MRETRARAFFAEHGIEVGELSQTEVVRIYDRVSSVSIGADCEEYSSLVYRLAFECDGWLAYTKKEYGLCSSALFDIRLVDEDAPPCSSKPYKCSESDR